MRFHFFVWCKITLKLLPRSYSQIQYKEPSGKYKWSWQKTYVSQFFCRLLLHTTHVHTPPPPPFPHGRIVDRLPVNRAKILKYPFKFFNRSKKIAPWSVNLTYDNDFFFRACIRQIVLDNAMIQILTRVLGWYSILSLWISLSFKGLFLAVSTGGQS